LSCVLERDQMTPRGSDGPVRILALWSELLDSLEARRAFRDRGVRFAATTLDSKDRLDTVSRLKELYDILFLDASAADDGELVEVLESLPHQTQPAVLLLAREDCRLSHGDLLQRGVDAIVTAVSSGAHLDTIAVHVKKLAERRHTDIIRTGMEHWIRRLEREREAIMRSSFSLITFHDPDTRISWSNTDFLPGAKEGGEDHLAGRFCNEIWKMGDDAEDGCPVCQALETGEPTERQVETLDGYRMIQRVHPVRALSGELVGAIANTLDLHVLRPSSEVLASVCRLQECAAVAGGIAHRFNNLMSAVLMNAEISLQRADLDEGTRTSLTEIESAATLAGDLAIQLLNLARGGSPPPNIGNIPEEVARLSEEEGNDSKRLSIAVKAREDLWSIEADPGQIAFVVNQLLENSREASRPGGSIRLVAYNEHVERGRAGLDEGKYVVIAIEDRGEGMIEERRARIFEPFFSTRGPGRGMGLAAVNGIVENHGGSISVESAEGEGTLVTVYLPASNVEPLPNVRETVEAHPPVKISGAEEARRTFVLVVDDEEMVLDALTGSLEWLGYEVLTARSGDEGIRLARDQGTPIDAVLLDLMLPGLDAMESLEAIAGARPGVPIMVMSGYERERYENKVLSGGAVAFIQKPVSIRELSRYLSAALAEKG